MEEVEDRVAAARPGRVTRGEEDDYLLAASPDRRTADGDRLHRPMLFDPGRIARRWVAAVEPEVVEVAVDPGKTRGQGRRGGNERNRPAKSSGPSRAQPAGYAGAAGRSSDLEPAIRLSPGTRRAHEELLAVGGCKSSKTSALQTARFVDVALTFR